MDTASIRRKFEALGRNDLATGPLEFAECRIALGLKATKAVLVISPQAVSVLAVDWSGFLPPRLHKLDAVLNEADIAVVQVQLPVPEVLPLHGISLPERVSVETSRIPVVRIGAAQGFIIDLVLAESVDAVRMVAAMARTLDSATKSTADTDLRIRQIAAESLGLDVSRPDRLECYFATTLDEDYDPGLKVVLAISAERIGIIDLDLFTGDAEDDTAEVADLDEIVWGRLGLPPGTRLTFTPAGFVVKNWPGPLTLALGFDSGDRWRIRMAEPAGGRPAPAFYAGLLQRLDRAIADR
ncbi:hypothetical protein ASG92_14105 [Arthrobacter sp. Soil736]|nr:hypothetical protein ASG92_14105 [Arthrobacter sp. Soil736]